MSVSYRIFPACVSLEKYWKFPWASLKTCETKSLIRDLWDYVFESFIKNLETINGKLPAT